MMRPFLFIAILGLLIFFFISSTFFFKNPLFQTIFFKQRSFASELASVPTIDLKIVDKKGSSSEVVNILPQDLPVTLSWSTTGNPKSCVGSAWGIIDRDKSFDGPKNPLGGSFVINNINSFNPYVYTINCSNDNGDSAGKSVTLNLGASLNNLNPYISELKVYSFDGVKMDLKQPIVVKKGSKINIKWSSLNTASTYSVCVSSGSWPIVYKNPANATVESQFLIKDEKIYRFTIYCSNEASNTSATVNIFTE